MSSLEASQHETVSACGSGSVGRLVDLLVRSGRRGAQGSCWRGGAEGPWESIVLGWCTWCGGDPGNGLLYVMLSTRL
jgi:hypothetical protein